MTVRGKQAALALLLGLAFAAPAQAGTIVPKTISVCASGCDFTSINMAANDVNTNPGDSIEVHAGTYHEHVDVPKRLNIFGRMGDPMPVITWDAVDQYALSVKLAAAGTTLQRLDIRETATDGFALEALGSITASDLSLTAVAGCAVLFAPTPSQVGPNVTATLTGNNSSTCIHGGEQVADTLTGLTVTSADTGVSLEHGATLTDSTVHATGAALTMVDGSARRVTLDSDLFAVYTIGGTNLISDSVIAATGDSVRAVRADQGPGPNKLTLRNVTALASGSGSRGLEAVSFAGPPISTDLFATIDAKNVVARGSQQDVFATPAANPCSMGNVCAPGVVNIDHSNFVTTGGNVVTPSDAHNQSADPLFVSETDFHLASAASPLIGAGIADPSNGPTDRDGVPHAGAPTIGAYEHAPASPGGSGSGSGAGGAVVSNSLKFGRVKVGRDGTITIAVQVGAAGPLSATATTKAPAHFTTGKRKKKPKSFTYGKASKTAVAAGTVTLKIHPGRKAKKLLRRGARLKVAVKLRFSPAGAARNTTSKTVHVKLKHKRRRS